MCPTSARSNAPLVVLLHGCGQKAESFAEQTGWRRLADKEGFVLLMPGQLSANNRQGCFNWFRPADTGRDLGEAASIAAMVRAVVARENCDPSRVFVTGLSAGGAMTACLLAAYPDMFAAGAVVAGLPAGAANGVVTAMTRMSGHGGELSPGEWMARARALAPIGHSGGWPRLSIWHGDADTVVAPRNSLHLAQQWTTLQGLDTLPAVSTLKPGVRCESWGRPGEAPMVQSWEVAGMGHIYPTEKSGGVAAAREIARFWGLLSA
jgi:poly(hydroxyalkanoate) depolymerase family esterase